MDGAGRALVVTEPQSLAKVAVASPPPQLTQLTGWGANVRSECVLREAETERQVATLVDSAGTIARGLGRSYGDAALNSGKRVLRMTRFDRYLAFDEATGSLTCEAGTSLEAIIRDFGPRGWFPMITPGTKFVTVGGCIANDVHGKAHHAQGCFSTCVDSFSVQLASGEVVAASRTENADLFWASFGGMGLLGMMLTVTMRLRKVETTYFRQKSIKVKDLAGMLAALEENDSLFPYSVATLDVFASGKNLGRGVLVVGDHATRAELPSSVTNPLLVSGPPKLTVPFELPQISLNPLTIRLVNSVIQQIQSHGAAISHYEPFFYPLDKIAHWNRGYGKAGFTQYQFVIPFEDGERRMRQILETILAAGELPFLNVLKRMGKESGGTLSFPKAGYTYAIDFPMRRNTLSLLRKLDAHVLDAGGRIYLGKDSYCDAPTFRTMYPAIDEFLAVKAKYDPNGVFTSDLGRRVGLSRLVSGTRALALALGASLLGACAGAAPASKAPSVLEIPNAAPTDAPPPATPGAATAPLANSEVIYRGELWSGGDLSPVETKLSAASSGLSGGSYVMTIDDRQIPGTLSNCFATDERGSPACGKTSSGRAASISGFRRTASSSKANGGPKAHRPRNTPGTGVESQTPATSDTRRGTAPQFSREFRAAKAAQLLLSFERCSFFGGVSAR